MFKLFGQRKLKYLFQVTSFVLSGEDKNMKLIFKGEKGGGMG
jgi:hypothetical protein